MLVYDDHAGLELQWTLSVLLTPYQLSRRNKNKEKNAKLRFFGHPLGSSFFTGKPSAEGFS